MLSKSETVPLTGWMLRSGISRKWQNDASLKIKVGGIPDEDQCGDVEIKLPREAAGWFPRAKGIFANTRKYYNGKPVFVNNFGLYLYSGSTWSVGFKIGSYYIKSKVAGMCPALSKTWDCWEGRIIPIAVNTIITCSKHH